VESVRKSALKTMSKTFGNKLKNPDGTASSANDVFPLSRLKTMLCFETMEEVKTTCQHYGLFVGDASIVIDERSPPEPCVMWKRADFRPRMNLKTGHPQPLRPLKMVTWIEPKHGACAHPRERGEREA
jgi:hypothetical protein